MLSKTTCARESLSTQTQLNIAVLKVVKEKVSTNLPSSTWRPHWTLRAEQQRSSKPSDWFPLVYNISHTLVVLATRHNELHISIPSSCIIRNIFILIILLSHMSVTHFEKHCTFEVRQWKLKGHKAINHWA